MAEIMKRDSRYMRFSFPAMIRCCDFVRGDPRTAVTFKTRHVTRPPPKNFTFEAPICWR